MNATMTTLMTNCNALFHVGTNGSLRLVTGFILKAVAEVSYSGRVSSSSRPAVKSHCHEIRACLRFHSSKNDVAENIKKSTII